MIDRQSSPDAREAIHVFLTGIMAWLGFALLRPESTFDSSVSFSVMDSLAPEPAWGAAFLLTGAVGAWGMATRRRWVRLVTVLIMSTMHGVFALCLLAAPVVTTGSGTYGAIAGLGYYLAWRRAREGV